MTNLEMMKKKEDLLSALKWWYIKNNWTPSEFNLTGIRWEQDMNKDVYNDILVAWTDKEIIPVVGTTDPGVYYTKNRMNPKGCAHVKEGFYPKLWRLWYHNNSKPKYRHRAWVQEGNISIWQDNDEDFKYTEGKDNNSKGVFGINYHADVYGSKLNDHYIGYASAGCQVVENKDDLNKQISLFETTDMYKKGNQLVSYGLINSKDFELSPPFTN